MQGISRQTDYAVRAVLHLASCPDGVVVSLREIGNERKLPYAFVRQFIKKLVDSGILSTMRGKGGGIQLAKPASEITLLDVVHSTGGIELNQCVGNPEACTQAADCIVRSVWAKATKTLESYLSSICFSDLTREMNMYSKQQNDHSIIS